VDLKDQSKRNYFIVTGVITVMLSLFELIPYFVARPVDTFRFGDKFYVLVWIFSFLSFVLAFFSGYTILKPFSRAVPVRKLTLWTAFFASFLVVFSLAFFSLLMVRPSDFHTLGFSFPRAFFVSVVTTAYTYFAKLNFLRQTYELENEMLMKEKIKSQYETLKNELSPHFLFNSLNALKSMIREDPVKAEEYVQRLSSVLRYTVQSSESGFISLKEEMELASSYTYLLSMRYGENLHVIIDIPEKYQKLNILPLTIQSLVENAVKHNEISRRNPLTVRIEADDSFLTVSNNIQMKLTDESSLGIGLPNLTQRYKLLTGKDIIVSKDADTFIVRIPVT
jgi:sensor histidine kinase YesM